MAQYDDPAKLAAAQLARARKRRASIRSKHQGMCEDLHREAHKMLSGTIPEKALETMGHPYGRGATKSGEPGRQRKARGTRMRLPALPINEQSGALKRALRMVRRGVGDVQSYALSVARRMAPYAKYVLGVGGTRLMVSRPFWQQLQKSWRKRNFDLLVRQREEDRRG